MNVPSDYEIALKLHQEDLLNEKLNYFNDYEIALKLQQEEHLNEKISKRPITKGSSETTNYNKRFKSDDIISQIDSSNFGFYLNKIENDINLDHNISCNKTITEVITGNFHTALLSSYIFDLEWLLNRCSSLFEAKKVIIVSGESSDDLKMTKMVVDFASNMELKKPNLPFDYGTHHSKLALLFYETKIRVVVTTANFIEKDWIMKNQGIWFQDFPLKLKSKQVSPNYNHNRKELKPDSDFEKSLLEYLEHYKINFISNFVNEYDFKSSRVSIVASVPGIFKGDKINNFGLGRLRKLLLNSKKSDHSQLICQCSSIGSLDQKWLDSFSYSTKHHPSKMNIIWPSNEQVVNSIEGPLAGTALCFPQKNLKPCILPFLRKWSQAENEFLKSRYTSMPHIKTFCSSTKDGLLNWILLTSANMSKPAWGSFQKDSSHIRICSYEFGILFHEPNSNYYYDFNTYQRFKKLLENSLFFPLPFNPISSPFSKPDVPWLTEQIANYI